MPQEHQDPDSLPVATPVNLQYSDARLLPNPGPLLVVSAVVVFLLAGFLIVAALYLLVTGNRWAFLQTPVFLLDGIGLVVCEYLTLAHRRADACSGSVLFSGFAAFAAGFLSIVMAWSRAPHWPTLYISGTLFSAFTTCCVSHQLWLLRCRRLSQS